jgi:hypothetical protein
MPIPVICPACSSRFNVSDKFAGQTGPCPKCKKPITVPALVKAVTIHEPESPAKAATGRPAIISVPRLVEPAPVMAFAAAGAGVVLTIMMAWLIGFVFRPAAPPVWLLVGGAFVIAVPCVLLGYAVIRDRELEPLKGASLVVRGLICAAVYAGLWCVKGMLPAEATADMWQWLFLGPIFLLPGALAALATLELDWGPAVGHFSLYVLLTSLLRAVMGLPPL